MASPRTPLLTRVALPEDWQAGWAILQSEPGWPTVATARLPELQDDIAGKRGWIGRRQAMRTLQPAFLSADCQDHYRAASLLGVSPANEQTCDKVRQMQDDEMRLHNLTESAADALRGWAALADGCCIVEGNPIVAARNAARVRLNSQRRTSAP